MTINYIDTIKYVGTGAGSNKTGGAIEVISAGDPAQNYIYVAPRLNLITEVRARSREAGISHSIVPLHQDVLDNVRVQALATLNGTPARYARVFLMTHVTFLEIISRIDDKEKFIVIFDEEPETYNLRSLTVADEDSQLLDIAHSFLDIDDESVSIKREFDGMAMDVIQDRVSSKLTAGYKNSVLKELLEKIRQPVTHSVVITRTDRQLAVFSYIKPEEFLKFAEVTFLCAHFDHTILYQLWTKQYGVTFLEHPMYQEHLQDLAGTQGSKVTIGYLLDDKDSASRYTLETLMEEDTKVIDSLIDIVDSFFPDKYILALNKWKSEVAFDRPDKATVISTAVSGLNQFDDHHYVAVLATTNPEKSSSDYLKSLLKLTHQELLFAHQVHNDAQVCGRILRKMNNRHQKTFLVLGRSSAEFLHSIYEDSRFLGKVGSLPSVKELRRKKRKTPAYITVAETAAVILRNTEGNSVSSRRLKGLIVATCGYKLNEKLWRKSKVHLLTLLTEWEVQGQFYTRLFT